jgi:antitoxin ParD1/3/4
MLRQNYMLRRIFTRYTSKPVLIVLSPIQLQFLQDTPMRSTQQFSVTLPTEMAQMVKAKVSSGEYASESEVVRDGLRALQSRDKALESWLLREVVPAYDAMKADPLRGRSVGEVKASLAAAQESATRKR